MQPITLIILKLRPALGYMNSKFRDHTLESQSEMERIIRDLNGGEPSHVALFWLCAIFGLALLTIVLYSKLKQRGDAGEPHPSVEETHPQLGPYNPTYD